MIGAGFSLNSVISVVTREVSISTFVNPVVALVSPIAMACATLQIFRFGNYQYFTAESMGRALQDDLPPVYWEMAI